MARDFVSVVFAVLLTAQCCAAEEPAGSSPAKGDQKPTTTSSADQEPSNKAANEAAPNDAASKKLTPALKAFFAQLDKLGRDKVKDAQFITITFTDRDHPEHNTTENAWLLSRDENSIVVMKDDLVPWKYNTQAETVVPSSWNPRTVKIESIKDADFESECQKLIKPDAPPAVMFGRGPLGRPSPSYRALLAHAAWKNGKQELCEALISSDPQYKASPEAYEAAALEDLAWLHFLRGVNLLMFADRSEVIPHLRLAIELAPTSDFANSAKELIPQLEKLIAQEKNPKKDVDETKLTDSELAEFYVSQLKDMRCVQLSQPGDIIPYFGSINGKPDAKPPTVQLKDMGMPAVPALIAALEDDTPTRTIYHWRSFHHNRMVWRVSDFAWSILRDITKLQMGDRPVVGYTFSSMSAPEKAQTINSMKRWYAVNKDLSDDDRMFQLFSSRNRKDWITAGNYFLKQKDRKAVQPLLEKLPMAGPFSAGELCEIVAAFGDPVANEPIRNIMQPGHEHSDRLSAAIALYELGDPSGIPLAIEYATAEKQVNASWDVPIWFLMKTRSKEGIAGLRKVVSEAPAQRAGEVCDAIKRSTSGEMSGRRREPVGCAEICPVLIAAMGRSDYTGRTMNDSKIRVKDMAAEAFSILRDGSTSRFARADPKSFNVLEKSEEKRDAQIASLLEWHEQHQANLSWDPELRRLKVKE